MFLHFGNHNQQGSMELSNHYRSRPPTDPGTNLRCCMRVRIQGPIHSPLIYQILGGGAFFIAK